MFEDVLPKELPEWNEYTCKKTETRNSLLGLSHSLSFFRCFSALIFSILVYMIVVFLMHPILYHFCPEHTYYTSREQIKPQDSCNVNSFTKLNLKQPGIMNLPDFYKVLYKYSRRLHYKTTGGHIQIEKSKQNCSLISLKTVVL